MSRLQFSVKRTDSASLARSGVLRVGSSSIPTPFRWAAGPRGIEDRALHSTLPSTPNPLRLARLVTRRLIYTTVKNIEESNGKSQKLTGVVNGALGPREDGNLIRALHFRWNKSSVWRGAEVMHRTMSEREARAVFSFELPFRTDLHIPPIPSQVDRFDVFRRVVDACVSEAETFNDQAPILGYIPNIESLSLAERMVAYYDKLGFSFYGVDLAGGHPFGLISTVVRYLRTNRRDDYFLHAFNVRQCRPSEAEVVPIEDLLKLAYGFDSLSRVAFGGGPEEVEDDEGPTDAELIAKLRFPMMGDYGAYRLAALRRAGGKLSCDCRVCKSLGGPIGLLRGDYDLAHARTKAHGILTEADEYARIRGSLSEASFRRGLGRKTQAATPLRAIDAEISRIRAPSL
jgi:hypothetical protein